MYDNRDKDYTWNLLSAYFIINLKDMKSFQFSEQAQNNTSLNYLNFNQYIKFEKYTYDFKNSRVLTPNLKAQ